jgi:hypothetical protein
MHGICCCRGRPPHFGTYSARGRRTSVTTTLPRPLVLTVRALARGQLSEHHRLLARWAASPGDLARSRSAASTGAVLVFSRRGEEVNVDITSHRSESLIGDLMTRSW